MRLIQVLFLTLVVMSCSTDVQAQKLKEREEEFLTEKPLIGDPLPDVTVYSADGTPFHTADLRGQYTILTFGCLTCPPSMWNIAGLEAVQRDYGPKGVKFFFIYKSLAHPELAGNYVQPFTIEERLAHAKRAEKQLGTTIPWIVDSIDNRLKRALGDRPNSQFLVNPDGVVVRKRAWSNPQLVRADLDELVGSVDRITKVEDLKLKFQLPSTPAAPRGVVPRLKRSQMLPLVLEPHIDPDGPPFFAKLRAEASPALLRDGSGYLYIGFHLDPFHNAHWNNLTEPLSFRIEAADGVEIDQREMAADKVSVVSDADPREFLLNVKSWPVNEAMKLIVTYYACVGDESCHTVKQEYILHRARDIDGGGARGEGAGYWESEEFTERMLASDQNKNGCLSRSEAPGIILPHFEKIDRNQDGKLDPKELDVVTGWLNFHHKPGTPEDDPVVEEALSAAEPPAPGPDLLKFTPEEIEAAYEGKVMPEAVAMYLVIVRGGQLDGSNGWFGPAETRFDWSWLAKRNGVAADESLAKEQFTGDESTFRTLDRDRDGMISATDLDWSDNNPWVRQSYMIGRIFRRIEPGGNGNLTKEEWLEFFNKVAGEGNSIRVDQLRDALIPPGNSFSPGDEPRKETLIKGLMAGEIGSLQEGPDVDQAAPDFELRPLGGGERIRLSDHIGTKPVVLVFGNFTCGPFRSLYPGVEAVRERQKDKADFLMVYVREAHPTDGWSMKSNEKAGVNVAQPTTFEERSSVAEQCAAKLKPSMPLLVDDINDSVGNAYSGMPARLYVIDTQGKVAYKSGRGPFGFKPEEMEQALLMLTLDEADSE